MYYVLCLLWQPLGKEWRPALLMDSRGVAAPHLHMITASSGRRSGAHRIRWIFALFLVLLITLVVTLALAQIHPLQRYLVAARPLTAGEILSSDSVITRELDPGSMPDGAVLDQDRDKVLGQQVVIPFAAGDIITLSHLGTNSGRVAGGVPPQMRVLKLITKDMVMPDGLQAGDKIDMVLTLHDPAGALQTQYAIQGLVIRDIAPDNSSITLMVPPSIAVLMIHAQQTGTIVILAAPDNEEFAVVPPVTTTGACQVFLDANGQPTTPPPGATPCPVGQGNSTTPTPSPSPTARP